jgi:hypothetical protein
MYHQLPYLESKEEVNRVLPYVCAVVGMDVYDSDISLIENSIVMIHEDSTHHLTAPVDGWSYDCHSVEGSYRDARLWIQEHKREEGGEEQYMSLPRNPNLRDDYRLAALYPRWPYADQGLRGRVVYEMGEGHRSNIIKECWSRTEEHREIARKRPRRDIPKDSATASSEP